MSNTLSGKSVEYLIASNLLSLGLDVYMPLVDKGVDLIIRYDENLHVEIQIKSRDEDTKSNRTFSKSKTNILCFYIFCNTTNKQGFLQITRMWIFSPKQMLEDFPEKGSTALSTDGKYGKYYVKDLSCFQDKDWILKHLE